MIRRYITWITCLSYLFVTPLGASVICIGEDGHVAVERALAGGCSEGISVAAKDLPALTGHADHDHQIDESHCGPCTDFGLFTQTARVGKSLLETSDSQITPNLFAFTSVSLSELFSSAFHRSKIPLEYRNDLPPGSFHIQRSVVLLV